MPNTSGALKFQYGLQSKFDSIAKDANSIYFLTDTQRIFVGDVEYTRPVMHGAALPTGYNPRNSLFVKEIDANKREIYYSKDGASWVLIAAYDSARDTTLDGAIQAAQAAADAAQADATKALADAATAKGIADGAVTDAAAAQKAADDAQNAVDTLSGKVGTVGADTTVVEMIGDAEQNAKDYADGLAGNYATAAQGAKADSALQKADIAAGGANGSIKVKGTDVAVTGLKSAAFAETSAFDAAGAAAAVQGATSATVKSVADDLAGYKSSNNAAVAEAKSAADAAMDEAEAKVASVTAADKSVTVAGTATAPTVAVKLSADANNALDLAEDGLKVIIPSAAEYSITKDDAAGEYAAVYHLTKDGANIGAAINIPKDMVVQSGEVVTNPAGQPAGTYIKLVLQNVADPLYINVGNLIEYVTSGSAAGDMIVVAVSDDHKVTATITDGTITKAKLASGVQTSLGRADTALQKEDITSGTTNGTIKVEGSEVAVAGLKSAAYTESSAYATAAQGAKADSAMQSVTVLGTELSDGEELTVAAAKTALGLKSAAYAETSAFDAAGAATTAEQNAKAYADGLADNYATAAQGALADTALQKADIATGTANGTIKVDGSDVAVKGLGTAAYKADTAFDAAGAAKAVQGNTSSTVKTVEDAAAAAQADATAALNQLQWKAF